MEQLQLDFTFNKNHQQIGTLLKQRRKNLGRTQQEVADVVAIRRENISRIERHLWDIKIGTLEKYLLGLRCTLQISIIPWQ